MPSLLPLRARSQASQLPQIPAARRDLVGASLLAKRPRWITSVSPDPSFRQQAGTESCNPPRSCGSQLAGEEAGAEHTSLSPDRSFRQQAGTESCSPPRSCGSQLAGEGADADHTSLSRDPSFCHQAGTESCNPPRSCGSQLAPTWAGLFAKAAFTLDAVLAAASRQIAGKPAPTNSCNPRRPCGSQLAGEGAGADHTSLSPARMLPTWIKARAGCACTH